MDELFSRIDQIDRLVRKLHDGGLSANVATTSSADRVVGEINRRL
jgi:hypothetical protein